MSARPRSQPQDDARPNVVQVVPAPAPHLTVIVPVLADDPPEIAATHRGYEEALDDAGWHTEFVYVLHPRGTRARAALTALKDAGMALTLIQPNRWDGEMAAIRHALRHARGTLVLILPMFPQVVPSELPRVVAAADDCDMVVTRRRLAESSWTESAQAMTFQWLMRRLFGHTVRDLACRVRVCRRQVLEELAAFGAEPHFLPLLAANSGFRLRELEVDGSPTTSASPARPFARLRLALDALALYVVLKFTYKPFRFFGSVGLPILLAGLIFTSILAIERLFLGVGLADRPALILGVLLIVLGVQIIMLGLIGEIIIFAAGKRVKDYTIDKTIP